MMKNICGINSAPLVLQVGGSHNNIALSGYVNDNRTCGAYLIVERTKGAKSLTLCKAQGLKRLNQLSTNGAKSITLSDAQCKLNTRRNICGINSAPLVLRNGGSHNNIALSGYVNDNRTCGAYLIVECTKGAKSLT